VASGKTLPVDIVNLHSLRLRFGWAGI
jgi:hypothetical protein